VCVSTPFGEPLGQRRVVDSPCGSSSVATRDASDQFLPSHVFVRAPVPRRLPSGRTLARPPSEIPSASRQNESLRWVPRGPSSGFHRVGRCLPVAMRENRTSDTSVASCPEPVELALLTLSCRPPRPSPIRPRERCEPENDPRCLPSIEDLRPATPSRAPGSGLHEPRGFATALPAPDAFAPPRVLSGSRESWAAVHVIPLPAGIALLSASVVARRLLQPLRRTGTPFELPILAREWSFRPAARRHQPMPVALASPVRCHTEGLRAATRSRRLSLRRAPLARTRRIAGRGVRAKASRALL